ncbi:hypothetical protein [uncultured Microbacterium sp.]|uniref:hypothetical protein n=1 Tax=uncultured Microbacterium sp. TaxID=191216 RepID=UPI0035CB65E2
MTRGPGLTAVVCAERGAKIVSLRDDSGTEWLAQGDGKDVSRPDVAFVDAEMAGWDECVPSIVACSVDGRDVPDHGDLWNTPFTHEGDNTLVAIGRSLRYRFSRSIHPTSTGLLLSYTALALDGPVPLLWAAHPQFAAPPGTRVELPPHVRTVVNVQDPGLGVVALTPEQGSIDTVPPRGSRKWYVEPTEPVFAARLVRRYGAGLEMSWSRQCPYLGVWFDNRAFSREPVIAVEPSTGYFDSLSTAVQNARVTMLTPGLPLMWWVRLRCVRGGTITSSRDRS